MRCRVLLVLTATTLLCGSLPAYADAPPYGGARVAVGRSHANASVGTRWTADVGPDGRKTRSCTDVAYPLSMHGSVVLTPRRRLRMFFAGRVSSVIIVLRLRRVPESRSVCAARAGRDSRNPHRFKALLPSRLPCAALLDILASGPWGETDYWARIHTPGCTRVKR